MVCCRFGTKSFWFKPRFDTNGSRFDTHVNSIWYKLKSYILLTKFEGRSVSYGLGLSIYVPSAKRTGFKSKGRTRIHNLQYGPRKQG